MSRQRNRLFVRAALAALIVAASSGAVTTASAQSAGPDRQISISIAPQNLSDALRQVAEASGLQLVYDTRITDGRTSPGVSGSMSARSAIGSLLAGSGLSVQFSGDRTAIITTNAGGGAAQADDGVRAVGVVNVEGVSGLTPFGDRVSPLNGVNGSRDVQATEGTGSYTTGAASINSKVPQTLRETPASISVVTAQQIEDQALVSVRDIVEKITGVSVATGGNTEEFDFSSRGFEIRQLSIDGGAPLSFEYNNRPVIDISQFDSVQLVRGADGLFGGYSDPGGAVNLVRKKPLDHRQITYQQDIGSWDNFREEFDITGPLGFEGRLRGRLVLAQTDKNQFFDIAESHKSSVYGVVEHDLTPDMLLTFGGNYVQERNIPNQGGLPRYEDGGEIDFPVSTCFCLPWLYDDVDRNEVFAILDIQHNENLSSRLNITYNDQEAKALYYNSTSTVRRGVSAEGNLGGFSTFNPVKQWSIDYSANGKFHLFGREHSLIAGASYQDVDNSGGHTTFYPGFNIPDIFNYDPSLYQQPDEPLPASQTLINQVKTFGAYANLKLELLSNLHATVGFRYSRYKDESLRRTDYDQDGIIDPNAGEGDSRSSLKDETFSRPNIGLTYDFWDNFTLYGTYQSTYRPQYNAAGAPINFTPPPVTGENKELGVKWQSHNGRLNAFISGYDITQNGFLTQDFNNPGSLIPLIANTTSRGVDFEVAGEVLTGLQASIGYTYNENETEFETVKRPRSSQTPHNILKVFLNYEGQQGTRFDRFSVGGGFNLQSDAFSAGSVCIDPPLSENACQRFDSFKSFDFVTKGYTTFSGRVGYRVTDHVELSLNVDNIANLKTYASNPFQDITGYNYYIEPRSFVVSLRTRW